MIYIYRYIYRYIQISKMKTNFQKFFFFFFIAPVKIIYNTFKKNVDEFQNKIYIRKENQKKSNLYIRDSKKTNKNKKKNKKKQKRIN